MDTNLMSLLMPKQCPSKPHKDAPATLSMQRVADFSDPSQRLGQGTGPLEVLHMFGRGAPARREWRRGTPGPPGKCLRPRVAQDQWQWMSINRMIARVERTRGKAWKTRWC